MTYGDAYEANERLVRRPDEIKWLDLAKAISLMIADILFIYKNKKFLKWVRIGKSAWHHINVITRIINGGKFSEEVSKVQPTEAQGDSAEGVQ